MIKPLIIILTSLLIILLSCNTAKEREPINPAGANTNGSTDSLSGVWEEFSYSGYNKDCDTLVYYTRAEYVGDTLLIYSFTWMNTARDSLLVLKFDKESEIKRDTIVIE